MDELMSYLDMDTGADYLFEGFTMVNNRSTKSYLEAALGTWARAYRSVTKGQSAKAFHQRNHSTSTSYIFFDNQSTVNVFCNPALLSSIITSDPTLHLSCNYGNVPVNQVGKPPGYGRVWYRTKGIAKILGMFRVADNTNYQVRYDFQ